ncbi:MAG: hypothetical protein E1N59_3209 [Puniceicoccaceae bacterium 5H]|nr:MAG: hypothetical protein E1N59_3209 [Puniceicoccaceae bacterium 5H]
MEVILLTVFCSVLLAVLFGILFWHERRHRGFGSAEREALRPLEEDSGQRSARDHHS